MNCEHTRSYTLVNWGKSHYTIDSSIRCPPSLARSAVFAAMFKLPMQENLENYVEINDFNQNVVVEMLRFMYTGILSEFAGSIEDLLAAADKYGIERLKTLCCAHLVKSLSAKTAVNYHRLGDLYDLPVLRTSCEQFRHMLRKCFRHSNLKKWLICMKH